MEVQVAVNCGRCGKKETRSLSLEGAQELLERTEAKDELNEKLSEELNELLSSEHPDYIFLARNEGDTYDVKTLDSLCDSPDAKRNKGCKTRIETLLGDIFMTNEAPKKKAKVKSEVPENAENAETPENAENAA